MNIRESRAYWIGRLQEADLQIAQLRNFKSTPMKKRLKEAERLRAEAVQMIAKLSGL